MTIPLYFVIVNQTVKTAISPAGGQPSHASLIHQQPFRPYNQPHQQFASHHQQYPSHSGQFNSHQTQFPSHQQPFSSHQNQQFNSHLSGDVPFIPVPLNPNQQFNSPPSGDVPFIPLPHNPNQSGKPSVTSLENTQLGAGFSGTDVSAFARTKADNKVCNSSRISSCSFYCYCDCMGR